MTKPRIRIREIRSADDAAFRPAHALLRREFPRAEMLPVGDWRNLLRERAEGLWTDISWHLLVAERGTRVLATATGSYLGNVNVGLIGYVAVRPDARSSGLGPRLRLALQAQFEAEARRVGGKSLRAIVGEVRENNPWLRTLVRRHGALALAFPYVQPSLGGTRKTVPLVMYYQPVADRRKTMRAAELRRLLYSIWRRAYRVPRPLSHPEFRRMLSALKGKTVKQLALPDGGAM
jgi:ribosomal protein S18 acetylase RimI-like enzyme